MKIFKVCERNFVCGKEYTNAFQVDPKILESAIRTACKRAIDAEPNLTKWDMIMGDGDCGEAVQDVSKGRKLFFKHVHERH